MDHNSQPAAARRTILVIGAVVLLCVVAAVALFVLRGPSLGSMIFGAPSTSSPSAVANSEPAPQPQRSEAEKKELAYSMMCLGRFGTDAKAPAATREQKVALCDCIVSQAGLTATSPNYEAEMTRCFSKMLGQPYQQTAPAADGSTVPAVALPGSEASPVSAAPLSVPVSPYAAELSAIPAAKLPELREICIAISRTKAREFGSDEEVFLSMNGNYTDHCIVRRARREGLLPPETEAPANGAP